MNDDKTPSKPPSHRALMVIAWLFVGGITAIGIHALTSSSKSAFAVSFSVGALMAGASSLLGALAGFLFGIPRSLQGQGGSNPHPNGVDTESNGIGYLANTNLEQISDWLTKILVGVGLTQLTRIPALLERASSFLGPSLGTGIPATVLAGAILVYFAVCGFLFGYLWTRLFLAGAFREADLAAIGQKISELEKQARRDATSLATVQLYLDSGGEPGAPTEADVRKAVAQASLSAEVTIFNAARAQRNQNWRDEYNKTKMERTIPVFRAFVAEKTPKHRYFAHLGYALKDKRDPDYEEAHKMLTEAIRLRGGWKKNGWIFYEFNRAVCCIQLDEATAKGVPATKEIRDRVVADLRAVAAYDDLRERLLAEAPVADWMKTNNVTVEELKQS